MKFQQNQNLAEVIRSCFKAWKCCLFYPLFALSKNWGSFKLETESCAVWHVVTLIHIEAFGLIYCRLCQPLKSTDVTQTARWPRLPFHIHRRPLCWQPRSQLRNPKTTQWHNNVNTANTGRKVRAPFSCLHNSIIWPSPQNIPVYMNMIIQRELWESECWR